jgi:hypothetical protein
LEILKRQLTRLGKRSDMQREYERALVKAVRCRKAGVQPLRELILELLSLNYF